MQLKAEREAEGQSRQGEASSETWTGAGPAAKSHLTELTRLMEGARTESGKNFSQLLQKLDNIKQVKPLVFVVVFVVNCEIDACGFATVLAR